MHPFLFELFGFKVYAYGMTMVAAFIICLLMTVKNRSKDLLSLQDIYNLCLLAMASLLFGPKLAELVTQTAQGTIAMSSVLTLLKFWEPVSFSFLPVFLLAVILLFTYCRWKHIPILKVMDDLVPIAIFGVALQRCFGCFMGGCCYGTPTNLPWGIVFPGSSKAGIHFPGLNLHPTQLYYGMTALMIYFFLMRHRKHFKEHKKQGLQAGVVTGSGLIMLGLSYFVITFMRGDIPSRQIFFHLSISQYLSLALFATGLIIFLLKKRTIEKITGGHVKKTILMCFLAVCLIFTGTAYDVYSAAQNNIKKNAKKKLPPKDVRLFAGDLGSISNPVKCDGTQGQIEYLKRLRSPSRKSIKYRRLKHANPVPNGHTLDVYEIKSRDGRIRAVIHMDMYWPGYIESQAIKEFKIKESKGPKHITYRLETQPLTPHHVYQMILDYGFYCEIISGNPFHKEALQGINIPAKSVFPLRRSILDRKTNHGNIETWSQVEFNSRKTVETNIMLSWYPKIVNCSFDNAINILNNYNHEQKGGHFQWRIPTITELFSIIDSKSLLPGEFALRRGDDFTFWTSTPVMKKGTLLEASKSKKAYYIVRCRYININDTYSISFNYLDIEQKKPLKAHLLPVFSEKQYAYTAPVSTSAPPRSRNTVPQFSTVKKNKPGKNTVNSVSPAGSQNTIPGFSTNPKNRQRAGTKPSNTNSTATSQDKIPGFDDIPSKPSKKHPPTKKPVLKTPNVNRLRSTYTEPVKEKIKKIPRKIVDGLNKIPGFDDVRETKMNRLPTRSTSKRIKMARTAKIAIFPYMWKGFTSPSQEQRLNKWNREIASTLKVLTVSLNSSPKYTFTVDIKDASNSDHHGQITRFYKIMSASNSSERDKLLQIQSQLMVPQNIDIILTLSKKDSITSPSKQLQFIIISPMCNTMYYKDFPQSQGVSPDMKLYINCSVDQILSDHFK